MTNSQRLAIVRTCLRQWLQEREEGRATEPILRESILIRNEFYRGRQFHTSRHRAVWFIEEDQLKIYDDQGEVVAVMTGEEIDSSAESNPTILKLPQAGQDQESRRAA